MTYGLGTYGSGAYGTSVISSAQGRDVSNFQVVYTAADWKNYSFGFAKATEGINFTDRNFAANWANMKSAGIARGAYHFFHPANDPIAQANFFVSTVKAQGLRPGDMLVADIEILTGNALARFFKKLFNVGQPKRSELPVKNVSMSTLDSASRVFLDEVQKLVGPQNPVIVYTNLSVGSHLLSCTSYSLWSAWPSSNAPSSVYPWPHWRFWQWGIVNGVDRDAYNGTETDLQTWIKSFTPITPPPTNTETSTMILNNGLNAETTAYIPPGKSHLIFTSPAPIASPANISVRFHDSSTFTEIIHWMNSPLSVPATGSAVRITRLDDQPYTITLDLA